MRASRTKKPGVGTRARAKRPGTVGARKGGENGEKRVVPKAAHAKPRGGSKPAAAPRAANPTVPVAKETAPVVKAVPVLASPPAPRGNPPPLPAPIASFNF